MSERHSFIPVGWNPEFKDYDFQFFLLLPQAALQILQAPLATKGSI